MSQAGRDECQTFPVATLNNNDRRSKVAMANPRLLQTLSHGQCAAAAIMILARQRASKRQFQAQGLRPTTCHCARSPSPPTPISRSIEPSYSQRQKAIVERWEAEGRWTRQGGKA